MWLFIVNLLAGNGLTEESWPVIESYLEANQVEYAVEFPPTMESTMQTVRRWAVEPLRGVIAVGGDGTVHGVANGILQTTQAGGGRLPLGIVPTGVINDFAQALAIPLAKALSVTRAILQGTPRFIDIGVLISPDLPQPLYFVNGLLLGVEPTTATEWEQGGAARLGASWRYLAAYNPPTLSITHGNQTRTQRVALLAYTNGPRHLGSLTFAPHAHLDDGVLELTLIRDVSRWTALRLLQTVGAGTALSHVAVTQQAMGHFSVTSANPIPLLLDGESLTRALHHVELRSLPRALAVLGA